MDEKKLRGDRLRIAREAKGLTKKRLADILSVSPTTIFYYEEGKNAIPYEAALKLSEVVDVNPSEISEVPEFVQAAEIKVSEPVPVYNQNIVQVIETTDSMGNPNITLVPVKARAGYVHGYGDLEYVKDLPAFSIPYLRHGSSYRAFEVEDYSMYTDDNKGLYPSDIAICEATTIADIKDDRIYVVVSEEGVFIKRVLNRLKTNDLLILNSDNPDQLTYKPIFLRSDQIYEVWELKRNISSQFPKPTKLREDVNELRAQVALLHNELQEMWALLG